MSKKYSRKETIEEFQKAIKNIAAIYNEECIKWKGKTKGKNGEFYSEIIAEELIRRSIVEMFSNITPISRENYNIGHDGKTKNKTNREEEIYAKSLYRESGNELNKIGKIFDYQVPLKASQSDKAGKIDLVSYNKSEKIVYLLELKDKDNEETLLRCVLEIATYYQLLNKPNFIKSYSELKNSDVKDKDIKKGILIFKESSQYKEVKKIECQSSSLKTLIKSLEVEIFVIDDSKRVEHILL